MILWTMDALGEGRIQVADSIRDGVYVNSIREDSKRVGVLFTDTNHGGYFFCDEGTLWRQMIPNLPNIPITYNLPWNEELAIPRGGRERRAARLR